MKKLLILFSLAISVLVTQAQILDTISLDEFKTLKYKQVKALYQNDEDGLELIKKSHTRKINSYVFFGLSVPFAVTLNPSIWMPLTPAVIKLSNNTKRSLYYKLKYYERVKYNKDTIKMVIPEDTNSYVYKYANYEFDMTFEKFKALGKERQSALLNINDTTQYIFDYSINYSTAKVGQYILSGLSLTFGALFLSIGVTSYLSKGYEYRVPMIFGTGIGTASTLLGVYLWPSKEFLQKNDKQKQTYNNLQQYYLTHKVYSEMATYIKNRREQYKPKPFLN